MKRRIIEPFFSKKTPRFTPPRISSPPQFMKIPDVRTAPRRIVVISLLSTLAFTFFLQLGPAIPKVNAYISFVQNDWSGGTGTGTNQYTSVDNINVGSEITLGNNTNDWCNTANCNTNWTRRQTIRINNLSGGGLSDIVVSIGDIPHKEAMQSDFDDLRFVDNNQTTELQHFTGAIQDDVKATVYVKLPTLASNSIKTIYMYYGENSAPSTSDDSIMLFTDGFKEASTTNTTLGEWGQLGTGNGDFNQPKGIAVHNDWTFIADSLNDRVVKINDSGAYITSWGSSGSGDGQFLEPTGIAVNPANAYVYVLDKQRSDVQVFDSNGVFQFKFGAPGSGSGQLSNASDIAICGSGVAITDSGNNRISIWGTNGVFYYTTGSMGSDYGQFNNPQGIGYGDLWGVPCVMAIADSGNDRIVIATSDGTMVPGNLPLETFGTTGNDLNQLASPTDVAINQTTQTFYVADSGNNRIKWVNNKGLHLSSWQTNANYIATRTSNGRVYTTETTTHKTRLFTPPSYSTGLYSGYNLGADKAYDFSINDNELTTMGNALWFEPYDTYDRTQNRTYEFDVKIDLSYASYDCNNPTYGRTFRMLGSSTNLTLNELACIDDAKGHAIGFLNGAEPIPPYDGSSGTEPYRIPDDRYIRMRATALEGGGWRWYIAFSDSSNYELMDDWVPVGTASDNSKITLQTYSAPTTIRNVVGYNSRSISPAISYGVEEYVGGKTGSIESIIFDAGSPNTTFNSITATTSGTGTLGFYIRGGATNSLTDDYYYCGLLQNGAQITDSNCASNGDRYLQYKLVLSEPSGGNLTVNEVEIQYLSDTGPPETNASNIVIKKSASGDVLADGSWTNDTSPYFSWDPGADQEGGTGLAGYCIYFGTNPTADPATDKGAITDNSPVDVGGACPYVTNNTHFDVNQEGGINQPLDEGATYYFSIKAIDNMGQIFSGDPALASIKIDTTAPFANTAFGSPAGFINSKIFSIDWAYVEGLTAIGDTASGAAGFKYCVTNVLIGISGCTPNDPNWYGANHTSGLLSDTSDVFPVSAASLSTSVEDASRLDSDIIGANFIYVALIDNAGNFTPVTLNSNGLVLITTNAPSAPTNLQVNPASNTANSFSFTWDEPITYVGPKSDINYCYTVNEPIEADASNCTWTGKGIQQLANGPYATLQGTNTLYLMARDQSTNFNSSNITSVTFDASTAAPSAPLDVEISDVSTRVTSNWKLALSWSSPTQNGSGITSYKIFRSTDNVNFSEVGSTSPDNLSFIDAGLSQVTYYYHIKACDSASACSAASTIVSMRPTGRFTSPPNLTAASNQPRIEDVSTKNATIIWYTDRESDSKVAIGTASGQYAPSEVGNSSQVTEHRVTLSNLQPGTTYYFVAKWTDEDGNTGVSQERTFKTSDAPIIKNADAINTLVTSTDIRVTVQNAKTLKLLYGPNAGFGTLRNLDTSYEESQYNIPLAGLTDGQRYFYKFILTDAQDNEYSSDIYTFTTPPRPRIENLRFQPVEGSPSSTQKVTWTTNIAATSALTYGPRGGEQSETISSELTTNHEVVISGLLDDSDYTLVARSTDGAGNTAVSETQSFRTALDTRPPKISDISVETSIKGSGGEAKGQVIVSWKTDELATSQVAYAEGQTQQLTSSTPEDSKLTTEHVVVISDLSPASLYSIQPVSRDKGQNSGSGEIQTAIIGRASDSVFTIIYNALKAIFGLK